MDEKEPHEETINHTIIWHNADANEPDENRLVWMQNGEGVHIGFWEDNSGYYIIEPNLEEIKGGPIITAWAYAKLPKGVKKGGK